MKIALMNEFSQSGKNSLIYDELKPIADRYGHTVVNTGMIEENDPYYLTYLNLGVQAALLLNSGAVDFVITGCGTGQGALLALNSFPGVSCGYCIEPGDAYLFLQINNGNALALPFAKGFGWGADVNLRNIFQCALSSPKGMGYPNEERFKESQNRNAAALMKLKEAVHKPLIEGLRDMDREILLKSLTPRFMEVFLEGCQDESLRTFILDIQK